MSKKTLQEQMSEAIRVSLVLSSTHELLNDEGVNDQSILNIANTLTKARMEIEHLKGRITQLEDEPPKKPPFYLQKGEDGYWLVVELPEGSVQFSRGAFRIATEYFTETLDAVVKMTNPHNKAGHQPQEENKP